MNNLLVIIEMAGSVLDSHMLQFFLPWNDYAPVYHLLKLVDCCLCKIDFALSQILLIAEDPDRVHFLTEGQR